MSRSMENIEATKQLYRVQGDLNYLLDLFGDELALRHGYKSVYGIEAVHFHVIKSFGWLPRDVRSMSMEDLRFVLSEEIEGWTVPRDAVESDD